MLRNLLLLPPHTLLYVTTRVNNNQLLQEDNPTIDNMRRSLYSGHGRRRSKRNARHMGHGLSHGQTKCLEVYANDLSKPLVEK